MSIRIQMASPLEWPAHVPRTPAGKRRQARFRRNVSWPSKHRTAAEARDYVRAELERLGASMAVISTDYAVNQDGWSFTANRRDPDDPGIAVYFDLDGERQAIAIDVYDRAPDSLWAVGRTIEAFRQIERDGGPRIMRTAVSGFKALPASTSGANWWEVLELESDAVGDEIRAPRRGPACSRCVAPARRTRSGGSAGIGRR